MTDSDALSFIDTNVLLYAYDASAGQRHEQAAALVGELGARRRAAISIQVLQEFYVNAVRKIAHPLTHAVAVDRLRVLSHWPTHTPNARDVIAATQLGQDAQLSFWDAMIIRSAAELGAAMVWSEDLNDGQLIMGVQVRNPFA